MENEIKKAESRLLQIAQQRREAASSKDGGRLRIAEAFRDEMTQALMRTFGGVSTVVKTVDRAGNIITQVTPGLPMDITSESALVYSNIRSKRARAEEIRRVVKEVESIIEKLRNGGPTPADLKQHLQSLRESIPADLNEFELITGPKSKA